MNNQHNRIYPQLDFIPSQLNNELNINFYSSGDIKVVSKGEINELSADLIISAIQKSQQNKKDEKESEKIRKITDTFIVFFLSLCFISVILGLHFNNSKQQTQEPTQEGITDVQ